MTDFVSDTLGEQVVDVMRRPLSPDQPAWWAIRTCTGRVVLVAEDGRPITVDDWRRVVALFRRHTKMTAPRATRLTRELLAMYFEGADGQAHLAAQAERLCGCDGRGEVAS